MSRRFFLIAALFGLITSACHDKNNTATPADLRKLQTRTIQTEGYDLQKIDINNDGKTDQFIYSKEGNIAFIIRDFNFDEVNDMTEFFEEGKHVRDEIDLDYDGICDLIITYENDLPVKKEYSVDFEGNRHGIQFFDSEGNRTSIHRDTDMDGKLDLVEYYKPGEEAPYRTEPITRVEEED